MNPFHHFLGFRRVATATPVTQPAAVATNVQAVLSAANTAMLRGAEIAVFPELCITGYSCGDLFLMPDLLQQAHDGLLRIAAWTLHHPHAPVLVVGLPMMIDGRLYNMAAVIASGSVKGLVPKTLQPTSQEYYDARWFTAGSLLQRKTVVIGNMEVPCGADLLFADSSDNRLTLGVEICEDLWGTSPPSGAMARAGATLIVNPSASNELVGKAAYRRSLVSQQSARTWTAYAYTSAGPGESTTDMVFGGHQIIAEAGEVLAESPRLVQGEVVTCADIDVDRLLGERLASPSFRQELVPAVRRVLIDVPHRVTTDVIRHVSRCPFIPETEGGKDTVALEIMRLQTLGLAMRVQRSGCRAMVVGVSGGLDSTLALLVCTHVVKELNGEARIVAVTMPGPGTSPTTLHNARTLTDALGIALREIDISSAVTAHLADITHNGTLDVTFENAQARERTQILMDISNTEHGLVVGTGDMSELALGWCTYNADQMSMYGVNSGVPKTLVQHILQSYAQHNHELTSVLNAIIDTPISPELLPVANGGSIVQRTEDILGPYELHDFFLYHTIRMRRGVRAVLALAVQGFGNDYTPRRIADVYRVFLQRFIQQQFKRSAMPDGVKVGTVGLSPRADWRMPSDASAEVWLRELDECIAGL